jgi:hypothetical protein
MLACATDPHTPGADSVEGALTHSRAPHSRVAQPQGYMAWIVCVFAAASFPPPCFPSSALLLERDTCVWGGLVTHVIGDRGLLRLQTACQACAQTVAWWKARDSLRKYAAFHQANSCARAGHAVDGAVCGVCNLVHMHDMSRMEGPWVDGRVPKAWSSGMCTQPVCVTPQPTFIACCC